jgi:hypothetical protein
MNGCQTRDESHVSNSAVSSAANSNNWLESFSNWRNVGVISQLASATMIEFLPLPV